MANPGINTAYESFKSFNELLVQFENQTVKTTERLTAINAGLITMGNVFNTQKLPESMKLLADSLKSFNLAGTKLKNLEPITTSLSAFLTKMSTLGKKDFNVNTVLEKVSLFFDNLVNINSKITKFKFDSAPLKSFFEFITSLSTLKINQANIDKNLDGLSKFLTKLSGTKNTITGAQKTTDALGHFKASAKTLNLGTAFTEIASGFKSLFASNSKNGLFDAFKNIDIGVIRNITLAQQAISGLVSVISTLSSFKASEQNVADGISSIDKITSSFVGKNTFQKLSFAVSGISSSISTMAGNIAASSGKEEKLGMFFRGLKGLGASIGSGLSGFLAPSGFIERFAKFSSSSAGTFNSFTKGITDLFDTLRKVSTLKEISVADISNVGRTLDAFVKSFTGITGLERTGGIIKSLFNKDIGGAFGKLAGMFSPSIIKRISSFGGAEIQAFSRFSSAVIHIANAVQTLSSFSNVNPDIVVVNLKAIKALVSAFTGSGISGFLGFGGFIKKFTSGDSAKNLSLFGKALFDFAASIKIISNIDVNMNKMFDFIRSIKKVINELSKIRVGRNSSSLKAVSSFFSEITTAASNVNLSNIKDGTFVAAGKRTARGYIKGFKQEMQIASPSKVMISLGKNISEGLAIGISNSLGLVINSAKLVGTKITSIIKNIFSFGFGLLTSPIAKIRDLFGRFFNRVGNEFQNASNSFEQRKNSIFSRIFNFGKNLAIGSFAFNQIGTMFSRVGGFGNAAIDFESRMTDVFKTVDLDDLSAEQAQQFMENFGETITELATSRSSAVSGLSDSFSQLFSIGIQAGSAGIKKENLTEFINTIGQLVIASDLTAEAGTSELASFATVTGTEEYARLGSTIVELGNKYNATESKIVSFGQRLAGLKTGTNLTEANILAMGAALGSVGLESEAGGTAMTQFVNSIVSAVAKGGKELTTFSDVAGVTSGRFVKLWGDDPIRAINKLIKGFGEMSAEEQLRIFDELGTEGIRLTDMVRRLAGAEGLLGDAVKTANEAWDENTALTEEARKQSLTTRASLSRMGNAFNLLRKTLFDLVLNEFQGFIDSVTDVTLKISDFIKENENVIKRIFPAIAKFLGIISLGFAATSLNLGKLLTVAKTILLPLSGLLNLFSGIVSLLFNPIGLIAGFLAIKFVPQLIEELGDKTSTTYQAFSNLWESVKNLFSGISDLVGTVFTLISGFIQVKGEAETTFSGIATFISPVAAFIQDLSDKVTNFVNNLKVIGQALGIDMGINTQQEEINRLLLEREEILNRLNNPTQATGTSAGLGQTSELYKILSGDTLYGIADQFGVTLDEILAANPQIENPSLIFAGKELNIPVNLVDAEGNPIETPADAFEQDPEIRRFQQDRLFQIDETITKLENLDMGSKNDTFLDRLESLKDTDIFKRVFGDDSGALQRAKDQITILQDSMTNIKDAGTLFSSAITSLISGDFTTAIRNLKDAGLEFLTGISSGLGALFGNTNPANSPTVQAALKVGISDTGFGEGISNAGSFTTNPMFDKITEFIEVLGDKLSFIDTIDLTGIKTFFEGIVTAITSFAAPILEKAGGTITDIIIPAIENILGIFTGDSALGEVDLEGIASSANFFGDIIGDIIGFLGTVASVAGTLAAGTVKLIVDLFAGIGGLINNIKNGKTDIFSNLNEFLFQPLLNFGRNISIGALDAVSNFLESFLGIELPSGEELFGDIINFFEDMIRRFQIGLLDLRIEFDRFRGLDVTGFTNRRALYGLSEGLSESLQGSLDSGVPVDLSNVIKFTYNGEEFTGSIGELLSGSLGNLGDTITTDQRTTLQETAKRLYDQFLTSGDESALISTIDIYELLGRPDLGFDFTKIDTSTLDSATIANGILSKVFNFENLTASDVSPLTGTSGQLTALIMETFTSALGNVTLGATGDERLTAANNILYSIVEGSTTLTDLQKSILLDTVDGELEKIYTSMWDLLPDSSIPSPETQGVGTAIADGLIVGMESKNEEIGGVASGWVDDVLGTMRTEMGIESPSTVMQAIGTDIVSGLILGINGSEQNSLLAETIKRNLVIPFQNFNMQVQIVIASIDSLIKKLLELGTTPGASAVMPKLTGGLKYGGSVLAGNVYEVLEDKLPFEIFKTQGGRNYFLPNENGMMLSPAGNAKSEYTAAQSSGNAYNDNSVIITVPVTFESVPANMSRAEVDRLASQISNKIKNDLEDVAKRKTVSQRLERRGLA